MKCTVLSHAGLLIESQSGVKLLCDPWLIGSCYWRSWWNYPPVKTELIENLNPDIIYLTHIHWDHFHGPSLERFSKDVRILVPKGNYDRSKKDLASLGFHNVYEMKHGESYKIDDDFELTSYQFGIFLDSAALISCDGSTLLNLNDTKHMGATLQEIVKKHNPIDLVFRSHSSANSRMSYEIIDEDSEDIDDIEKYIKTFADTVRATGAKFAVPFASNHCLLHEDSYKYNESIQTPDMIQNYFSENKIDDIELKVMISGDSWDSNDGFDIAEHDWFSNREERLEEYLNSNQEKLDTFAIQENKTKIKLPMVEKYYSKLSSKLPFLLKRKIKNIKYTYVLYAEGVPSQIFNIDIAHASIEELDKDTVLDFNIYPIQIHTTAFIFLKSIRFGIFSHMAISKRVIYKLKKENLSKMQTLNLIYNFEEYDMLPVSKNFSKRSIQTWILRYREIFLYILLLKDKVIHKELDFSKYLIPFSSTK